MAELADGRVYKRKRIKDPTDENNYIDIPVIYSINTKCQQEQAQEFQLTFNNSSTSSRKTHVKRVTNIQDASQYIDVERIDEWISKTTQEQAQEHTFILRNTDPPPIQPDGTNNPAHEQKHIVRYYKDNEPDPDRSWIDCELIDELRIVDASSQYQEWRWVLKHPELGAVIDDVNVPYIPTLGYCDPSLEQALIEDGFDPPYRLDPLQNIVNCRWNPPEVSTSALWHWWVQCYMGGSPSLWSWAWLQREGDPPYEVPETRIYYGEIGYLIYPDEFNVSGWGINFERYQSQMDIYAADASSKGKIAVVSFAIVDEAPP